jgi:hypothetical protein
MILMLSPFFSGEPHRFDDFRVGPATAQVSRKVMLDDVLIRLGMLLQQLAGHHDETRGAESALECAGLDERLLHGIELGAAFDRFHAGVLGKAGEIEATGYRAAVHEDGAAAAHSLPAALSRTVEAEVVLQHLDQALVRRDLRRHLSAVQPEAHLAPHFCIAMNTASAESGSAVRRTPTAS